MYILNTYIYIYIFIHIYICTYACVRNCEEKATLDPSPIEAASFASVPSATKDEAKGCRALGGFRGLGA